MKQRVRLMDNITNEILYQGESHVEQRPSGGMIFHMKDDSYKGSWKVLEQGVILEHQTEMEIRILLKEKGQSKAEIKAPFGMLEMKAELKKYQKSEERIEVEYSLEGQQQLFSFTLWLED